MRRFEQMPWKGAELTLVWNYAMTTTYTWARFTHQNLTVTDGEIA